MIKRILAGLGGSPYSETLIDHSVELAKNHKAELTGVTILNPSNIQDIGPFRTGLEREANTLRDKRFVITKSKIEKVIDDFEHACRKKRVKFTVLKETGNPFNLFLSHSRYHDLALLAIKGFFDYGIVKDPKEVLLKLIKEGVRPIIATSLEYRPIKKVLIAYSGSMESAKAMKRFVQLRPWDKCKIKIVCYEKAEKEAEKLLSDAMRYCNSHGLKIQKEYFKCPPEENLLKYIHEWDADLLVMGNSMRNLFLHQVLGDVTVEIVQNSKRTLFLCQ